MQAACVSQLLNLRKERALVGRETRQKIGWQNVRMAKDYIAHGDVARGLGLSCPSPVGVKIEGCGITELRVGSRAEGVQVSRGDGRGVSRRRKR